MSGGSRSSNFGAADRSKSTSKANASLSCCLAVHKMLVSVDSGRCRSAFRNDVDQDYELMPITIPTRCRSQIG
jgi:hypothetical protein